MSNSSRFKFPKTVVFVITGLYLLLMVATYFLYFKEPFVVCAKRLMLGQALALVFQIILNYVNYRSKEKIVILATLFISAMLLSGVLSSFFKFELMCKYLGY